MAQQNKQPKPRIGRPPVNATPFDSNINFNCFASLPARVEVYRRKEGLRSEAEACRVLLDKALRAAGIK